MEKKKEIIELIKEDRWHNIPVERTVDKILSILGVVGQSRQLTCLHPYDKVEQNDKGQIVCKECNKLLAG